jgi:excisionase family DNA binding protein
MPEILTIDELGQLLKLSRAQIYSMLRKRGQARMQNPLPALKLNGNIRFRRQDIVEWLDKCAKENQ